MPRFFFASPSVIIFVNFAYYYFFADISFPFRDDDDDDDTVCGGILKSK